MRAAPGSARRAAIDCTVRVLTPSIDATSCALILIDHPAFCVVPPSPSVPSWVAATTPLTTPTSGRCTRRHRARGRAASCSEAAAPPKAVASMPPRRGTSRRDLKKQNGHSAAQAGCEQQCGEKFRVGFFLVAHFGSSAGCTTAPGRTRSAMSSPGRLS